MAGATTTLAVGTGAVNPFLGLGLQLAAGFLDSRFVYPAILGKNKTRPRELLGLPSTSGSPGEARVWALGRRIRVPLVAFFQSDKVRESTAGGAKGGQAGTIRRVFSDVGLVVNDRYTQRITQLIANGKLIWWSDRNLVTVRTSNMTLSTSSGRLVLTMNSNTEPDFADKFAVDDRVLLSGFVPNGGPSVAGYWKVNAVTHHGASPSTLTLDIYGGQTLAGLAATAGTIDNPAQVARVDDAFIDHTVTVNSGPAGGQVIFLGMTEAQFTAFTRVFATGDIVRLYGWTSSGAIPSSLEWIVSINGITNINNNNVLLTLRSGTLSGTAVPGTSTNAGRIQFSVTQTFVPGIVASEPSLHFYHGDDEQTEDDIVARREVTGSVPGFRGMSYQMLDTFDLSTYFGNGLPIFEGIIEPDVHMSWPEAILAVCQRYGMGSAQVDVAGVTARAFEGMVLQGGVPGTTALQPLLLAGQVATQERDGVVAFFEIPNADVVQVENGAVFSDLGVTSGADTPNAGDKIRRGPVSTDDLPTRMSVTHQDVDNVYARGSQPFGMRQPTANRHAKEEELDLSMLAMTRKEAKSIAATALRRAWINSTTVELQLPVAYLEVLENDLLTVTDDDDNDLLVRVIRREVGANFVVNIVAVMEHLNLQVHGSPVQHNGAPRTPMVQVATPRARVLDLPPLIDEDRFSPGVYLAACAPRGGHWAGCSVYESRDGGTSYQLVQSIAGQSGIGQTETDLDPGDLGELVDGTVQWDTVNTFDVFLDNDGPFPPVTVTETDVINGVNWCVVDDGAGNFEILGFRDVTDNGDGKFTLGHLLRGIRGTHGSAETTKAAGSNVVMLTVPRDVMVLQELRTTDLPATLLYKFVAPGQTLSDVSAITVSAEGWNARPMPVRDYTNVNNASDGDSRTFTLGHRDRINHPIGFKGPWALDEAYEGYRIRIYDPTGVTLMRVKHRDARGTGSPTLASPTFLYTHAQQVTDGYTPGPSETFWVEFEQLGDFGINNASGTDQRRGGRFYRQEI